MLKSAVSDLTYLMEEKLRLKTHLHLWKKVKLIPPDKDFSFAYYFSNSLHTIIQQNLLVELEDCVTISDFQNITRKLQVIRDIFIDIYGDSYDKKNGIIVEIYEIENIINNSFRNLNENKRLTSYYLCRLLRHIKEIKLESFNINHN